MSYPVDYVSNSYKTCPIDGEPISNNEIFHDRAIEREILGLQCYCENKEHGCQWSGIVADLKVSK